MPMIAPIEAIGEEPGGVAPQHRLHDEFVEWHSVGGYLLLGLLILHVPARSSTSSSTGSPSSRAWGSGAEGNLESRQHATPERFRAGWGSKGRPDQRWHNTDAGRSNTGSTRPRSVFLLVAVVVLLLIVGRCDTRSPKGGSAPQFLQADADRILDDPRLAPKTLARGRDVFLAHCAGCHGADGRGSTATGTPDLTDQDFLYGTGRVSEIESIVLHGIRSGDDKGWDLAWMPAFGQTGSLCPGKAAGTFTRRDRTADQLPPGDQRGERRRSDGRLGRKHSCSRGTAVAGIAMAVTRKETLRSALLTSRTASGCAGTAAGATSAASFGKGSMESVPPFAVAWIPRTPGQSPSTSHRFTPERKMNEPPGR